VTFEVAGCISRRGSALVLSSILTTHLTVYCIHLTFALSTFYRQLIATAEARARLIRICCHSGGDR